MISYTHACDTPMLADTPMLSDTGVDVMQVQDVYLIIVQLYHIQGMIIDY